MVPPESLVLAFEDPLIMEVLPRLEVYSSWEVYKSLPAPAMRYNLISTKVMDTLDPNGVPRIRSLTQLSIAANSQDLRRR